MKLLIAAIICFLAIGAVETGVVLTGEEGTLVRRIFIKAHYIRIDMQDPEEGTSGRMVYRNIEGEKLLTVIDEEASAYYEISASDMDNIKKGLDDFIEGLKTALKEMPEENRKLLPPEYSEMLRMDKLTRRVVREKRGVEFGAWTCDEYVVYQNGAKMSKAMVVDVKQLGLSSGDFNMLREIDEFIKTPAPGLVVGFMSSDIKDRNVVPVKIVEFDGEVEGAVSLSIKSIQKQKIAPSVFDVPGNMKRKELPGIAAPSPR